MIGSIFGRLLGCSHRRLTRPTTPLSKPDQPSAETYVVCLDCGRQFAYDWDHMRIGKTIERLPESRVLNSNLPGAAKTGTKYVLLGSAIPLAFLFGRKLFTTKRAKARKLWDTATINQPLDPMLDRSVELPRGGPGARFLVRELIDYIDQSGRDYIIIGDVDCALADHPKPSSLDSWLRGRFAKNKETKQATAEVISQLLATGVFERLKDLRCPDDGHKCEGLRRSARRS